MSGDEPPKYRQISDDLRGRIRRGEYGLGSRVPSKSALMAQYQVALGTVNDAIRVLRDEGLIRTAQGSGTFVCDELPDEASHRDLTTLSEQVAELQQRADLNDDLRAAVDRVEDNLAALYARFGYDYPRYEASEGTQQRERTARHG